MLQRGQVTMKTIKPGENIFLLRIVAEPLVYEAVFLPQQLFLRVLSSGDVWKLGAISDLPESSHERGFFHV